MNKKFQAFKYILSDFISAVAAWVIFYFYRKFIIEGGGALISFPEDPKFWYGSILIPIGWVIVYAFTGTYSNIYRKSRLKEFGQTIYISILGSLVIFFAVVLDDKIVSYKSYYEALTVFFATHLMLTAIPRFSLTSRAGYKIKNRIIGFNTLLIGSNQKALSLFKELETSKESQGNIIIGFASISENNGQLLKNTLKHLGSVSSLQSILKEHSIEEVIIAIESSEHESIGKILNDLEDSGVIVKIIPDMYDILSGSVKMNAIYGAPLIEISPSLMPVWQQGLKRLIDISVSFVLLLILTPIFFVVALIIKTTSKGPVFFSQERIGLHGLPFSIYKFRSMRTDAESGTPKLSSDNDDRITPFGKFMRKVRLDEIPQFWNVLKGDMSLVGPRPERQFYIDQIMHLAPHYRHLHKVRPGITSWGQVKFGYAENVDQMVERLKYDIIYIENMSLALDLKIMIYTIKTVLERKGK
ncbi:MAG: sugar transferase [Bacteroidota bacterium]|jgi:exopolysaccharide biosynthesis polyprenyl glycosylphosphotransferase